MRSIVTNAKRKLPTFSRRPLCFSLCNNRLVARLGNSSTVEHRTLTLTKHFDLLRLFGSLLRLAALKTGRISCRAISDSRDTEAGAVVFASLNYSRPLSHCIL